MTIEETEPAEIGDPAARIVRLATELSLEGELPIASFHRIVTDVELPASRYLEVEQAVEAAGIRLVPDEDVIVVDDPSEVDGGWNVDGYSEFLRHNYHRILTQEQEVALARRIDRGRVAQQALDGVPNLPPEAVARMRGEIRDGRAAASDLAAHNFRLALILRGVVWGCGSGLISVSGRVP